MNHKLLTKFVFSGMQKNKKTLIAAIPLFLIVILVFAGFGVWKKYRDTLMQNQEEQMLLTTRILSENMAMSTEEYEESLSFLAKTAENRPQDEATAFADPDNESRVQAAFSRLSEGKTVIMIAHRLSTVTNVDQIFVICNGQVAECGNSRELLAKDGIFSRMWKNYQTSVQWKVTKEVQ